jgi:hypothetical protein
MCRLYLSVALGCVLRRDCVAGAEKGMTEAEEKNSGAADNPVGFMRCRLIWKDWAFYGLLCRFFCRLTLLPAN